MFIVKLFVFITGLSMLVFLSSRFRAPFTEQYTFSKFAEQKKGMKENPDAPDIEVEKHLIYYNKSSHDSDNNIDIGGE
ncbi:hypothetical protein QA612_16510 [Evansella sp. AB-P1]|uniref:hypothetical protein n=1 Tax=Evansella sp. AB-P1 TaxID=3037653 RepID=UPI00241E3951|nr:hypothetical protein [Evansella sp. AB-P1]MDG5789061.1 hypothetical protein [Evansella sp. AB-P1]